MLRPVKTASLPRDDIILRLLYPACIGVPHAALHAQQYHANALGSALASKYRTSKNQGGDHTGRYCSDSVGDLVHIKIFRRRTIFVKQILASCKHVLGYTIALLALHIARPEFQLS